MNGPPVEQRPHVLVVDDDSRMRDILAQLVTRIRCTPLTARSIDRAAEIVAERHVDLMLLDLQMPGGSGLDLLSRLQSEGTMLPTIVVSGYVSTGVAMQAINAGVRGIVAKPFRLGRLIQEMRRVIADGGVSEERTGPPACPECGRRCAAGDRFCGECGASLQTSETHRPRLAAAV